jgi:hypothetical protein
MFGKNGVKLYIPENPHILWKKPYQFLSKCVFPLCTGLKSKQPGNDPQKGHLELFDPLKLAPYLPFLSSFQSTLASNYLRLMFPLKFPIEVCN